jgi:hypothetical protein
MPRLQPLIAPTDRFTVVRIPRNVTEQQMEDFAAAGWVDVIWEDMDLATFTRICKGTLPADLQTEDYYFFEPGNRQAIVNWILNQLTETTELTEEPA